MNKIIVLTLSVLLLASFGVNAQKENRPPDKPFFTKEQKERYQARKVAFITDKLELSPAEAATFWPVYNQHEKQMEAVRDNFHNNAQIKGLGREDVLNFSDEKANEILGLFVTYENEKSQIESQFLLDLREILPPQKVLRFFVVEREFKRFLLHELRNHQPPKRKGEGRRR